MAFTLAPSKYLFDETNETLNRKALIVDNNLSIQLHLQMILEDYFTKVLHANGIDEILSYVNNNHFDLVILDNDFLKKEYLSNTRYIWGLTERTKIIISLYEFKKYPTACFAYDTTLTKPITRARVEEILVILNLIKENHRRHLENFDPLFFPEIHTERISCQNIFLNFLSLRNNSPTCNMSKKPLSKILVQEQDCQTQTESLLNLLQAATLR